MGQKVNPKGMRLGIVRDWDAVWYADKDQAAEILGEDLKIREAVHKYYSNLTVKSKTCRCRYFSYRNWKNKNKIMLTIYTGRPGVVIGSKEQLNKTLQFTYKNKQIKSIYHYCRY